MLVSFSRFKTAQSSVLDSRERERLNQSSLHVNLSMKRVSSILAIMLSILILFFFAVIPIEFCRAVGSPTFFDSRVYPMGLIDEGDAEAGLKGRSNEYLYQSTSEWVTQIADLEDGNFMMQVNPISLPGIPYPGYIDENDLSIDTGLKDDKGRTIYFSCEEALNDYRFSKCNFLRFDISQEEINQWAYRQRHVICLAKKAGCKWTQAPETSDEYDPYRRERAKKVSPDCRSFDSQGGLEEWNNECDKFARS